MRVARGVAKSIVDRQVESHAAGKDGSKDVMSILGAFSIQSCGTAALILR
jgi:hypothetical protein